MLLNQASSVKFIIRTGMGVDIPDIRIIYWGLPSAINNGEVYSTGVMVVIMLMDDISSTCKDSVANLYDVKGGKYSIMYKYTMSVVIIKCRRLLFESF